MYEIFAIALYFSLVLLVGIFSYSRNLNSLDFALGNRSLNYWLTALAAHASDMSSWLFMAYPAMIFTFGLNKIWIAVGLIICMYANWSFIAPKIRVATEKMGSVTFFSYLESRFDDTSGLLRLFTTFICFIFYTIYISAGLVGLGLLIESLFHLPYTWAVTISILIALPYILIGGYRTLAWLDLFQGMFLMVVIVAVPTFLLAKIGGWSAVKLAASDYGIPLSVMIDFSPSSFLTILLVMLGWGLGYFGQPSIITKFMGIKNVNEISKSKNVGMSWMTISLAAATLVGLIGVAFFQGELANPEMVFVDLVKTSFHPFFVGFILCAVFAASINVMCSQILVLCTSFTEDIYKRLFRVNATSKELLLVSRLGVFFVSLLAFIIAYFKISTVYSLVLYAWSGLGAAFGPLLIFSLYSKKPDKKCAWVGILIGSMTSAFWPWLDAKLSYYVDPIISGIYLKFSFDMDDVIL